jgi:HlyD family secretion protein
MDKPRTGVARLRRIRWLVLLLAAGLLASVAGYGLARLKTAAPTVERAELWPDRVKRGSMLRDVRGTGTLVPEDFRWIPSSRDGLVEKIHVRIGDPVSPNTILAELSNPELLQSLQDTLLHIRVAEADLARMQAEQENGAVSQLSHIATIENNARLLRMQAGIDEELHGKGLTSAVVLRKSRLEAENAASQVEREKQRVEIQARADAAQLHAQQARIEQYRATYDLKKRQVEDLKIRAHVSGVLQQLLIEHGQRISAGTSIAKVAEPGHLMAQLKVPETQAKDILLGQAAFINTHDGIAPGHVARIDPAAVQGTVTVDVQFDDDLPKGARPDLTVEGTIEIERLDNVLYVGRPINGHADARAEMFRILPTGEAVRTPVRFGRIAVNAIEILDGLGEGDEVILSDMSRWTDYERVRLR